MPHMLPCDNHPSISMMYLGDSRARYVHPIGGTLRPARLNSTRILSPSVLTLYTPLPSYLLISSAFIQITISYVDILCRSKQSKFNARASQGCFIRSINLSGSNRLDEMPMLVSSVPVIIHWNSTEVKYGDWPTGILMPAGPSA